jgi:hypothetical protein
VPAPGSSLEEAYASGTTAARFTYLPRAALRLASDSAQAGPAALSVGRFSGGLGDYASLYPAEAKLLASLPANCVLLPRDGRFSFVAIDANHATSAESGVVGNVRFRFITQGLLLLAADEALLARSPGLAAYRPADVGRFSFANNRYPVIRAGDTVTYADIMTSFDFARPFRRGQNINPSRPIVLDIHRLNFPVPGEYCVRLNHKHTLRLLVLPRNSAAPESNRAIADFVTSNCASLSAPAIRTGGQTSSDLERLVTSETPAPLSEDSIQELTALLQSTFNASTAP